MKKLIILLLTLGLVIGLTACMPQEPDKEATKTEPVKDAKVSEEPVTPAMDDTTAPVNTEMTSDVTELDTLSEDLTDTQMESDLDTVGASLEDW